MDTLFCFYVSVHAPTSVTRFCNPIRSPNSAMCSREDKSEARRGKVKRPLRELASTTEILFNPKAPLEIGTFNCERETPSLACEKPGSRPRGRTSERLRMGKVGLHYALEHSLRDIHLLCVMSFRRKEGERRAKGEGERPARARKAGETTHRDQRVGDLGQAITLDELKQLVSHRRGVLRQERRSISDERRDEERKAKLTALSMYQRCW